MIIDEIQKIEKEIRETPYHKATEHHIGMLRARLSKLRSKLIESENKKRGGGVGYSVKKQGDATIILIGPPSVGKSTLINQLTNAKSKVAPYAFTTVSVIPGMMNYKDAKIQILDVPGLIEGAEEGKGRGREVLSVARGSDLILIMLDSKRLDALERIKKSLYKNGIRLNDTKPKVKIDKKLSGGIIIHSNYRQDFSKDTVKLVASELGLKNAEITIMQKLNLEKLIDSFSENRVYIPAIYVINKIDEIDKRKSVIDLIDNTDKSRTLLISAEYNINIDKLKERIWEELNFVRVYLIKDESDINYSNPLVVKKDYKLYDVSQIIGSNFAELKNKARIWGAGAKFKGQEVSLSTKVEDGMQIMFF